MNNDRQNLVGGEEGETLDLSKSKRALDKPKLFEIGEAIRRGWKIEPKRKRAYFKAMDRLIKNVMAMTDVRDDGDHIIGCNRILQNEQTAALRDLHHTERLQHESGILDLRMRRAEEGKPNDCVAVQVTPVRELPLPAALVQYRRKLLEPSES